jgi:hypothetical protein
MPTQIEGARFLAERQRAFLWDAPRVGKTGAAIMAADMIFAQTVLVVTTASGTGVWRQAFKDWQLLPRTVRVAYVDPPYPACALIVSWGRLRTGFEPSGLQPGTQWDVIILDEDQKAVDPGAQRSVLTYGQAYEEGARLVTKDALIQPTDRVWHLSGDPCPHDLGNAWMRLRASCPQRLLEHKRNGWPNVLKFTDFRARYCVVRSKMIAGESKTVVFGGQNEAELKARLEGLTLRRTQVDVGIQPPRYSLMPLQLRDHERYGLTANPDAGRLLEAIEAGETLDLDMHLGVQRRLTGMLKAPLIAKAVDDAFFEGVSKLVIAYWHKDVGDALQNELGKYGVVRLDGSTPPKARETREREFRSANKRVFLAQIEAAGEAIDLSPANELWFAETTFRPKDLSQMALRITNVKKPQNTFVRVCMIENSIDEALQRCVMRLWESIRKVVN